MTTQKLASDKVWAMIDEEKRRDRFIRRVSIIAWSITFVIALLFTIAVGLQVAEMARRMAVGVVPRSFVIEAAMPLIVVLGFLSLLIATLSTVGIFLRLRTASLMEIQLRLAALEEMLASRLGSNP